MCFIKVKFIYRNITTTRMPTRQRNNRYGSDEIDFSKHDPAYIIYKIGIYGWRKRCLYFLILLILVMAIINLALTIWIIRVQDFGLVSQGLSIN